MSLAFLTPDATPSREMRARSPMQRPAQAAGAQFSDAHGWRVASAYGDPGSERARLTQTVGFADRSSLAKLELQAEPHELARIVAQARGREAANGVALEPGLAGRAAGAETDGTWWCPVTPARVLVLAEPTGAADLRAALARACNDASGTTSVIDVTCGLAALSLVGPQARELLARFCAIDVRPALVPAGAFRPGSVARTPGYVLVEAPDRLLVLVGWALGEYLWRVVADAAASLGGGPVGARALAEHVERADA
jgi:heterotetrameric sarcosine oxidase gamma subunit